MTTPVRWLHDRRALVVVSLGTVGFVAAVYVVVVLGGGLLTGSTDSPGVGLSVLATAIVALGLEPGRAALDRLARRWFGGHRSPYDVLSGFTESVVTDAADQQRTSEPLDVPERMARLLAEATGAAWAQVWLEAEGRSELAATWPPRVPGSTQGPAAGTGSWVRTRDVVLDGRTLGTLRLCERVDQPLGPVEERLFSGLAGQAGMVLHRARLQRDLALRAADLEVRAEQLKASRRRLVDTHDAERRRLERDIHDGAQQHLVALVVNLRLAQTLAARSPERSREVLDEQVDAIDNAISALQDLSRGLYPHVLADAGIAAALRDVLRSGSVPVTITDRDTGRAPEDVETALYFCAVEAVQNATKHAGASEVSVELALDDEALRLVVRDDGAGFDPATTPAGHGLGNMRDRIDAVGGTLEVRARPGGGVEVAATVPAARMAGVVA
ncbi:MAG TPA: sensor histidine kinase [Nocardioides sp.]|nr:sensor histidine kinase [Nocardioides sp.]